MAVLLTCFRWLSSLFSKIWVVLSECVTFDSGWFDSLVQDRELSIHRKLINPRFRWRLLAALLNEFDNFLWQIHLVMSFSGRYLFHIDIVITVSHSLVQYIRNSRHAALWQHGQHNWCSSRTEQNMIKSRKRKKIKKPYQDSIDWIELIKWHILNVVVVFLIKKAS